MKEQKAIAKLKEGNISGLKALVRKYQVQAVRTAYLITRDRPLAEDIVQAAFLRAYERIEQFDSGRPFGPWFLRSVANDALKAVTRDKHHLSLEAERGRGDATLADFLADLDPGPEEVVEATQARQAVRDALDELPPEQRATIALYYYLDLSVAETAERLSCPPGTIKWRLHAARERLRRLLRPKLWPTGSESGR